MRLFLVLIALACIPLAISATISGTVYDLNLDISAAIVTIDTSPEQRIVAKDGRYSFTVPEGTYILAANATIDGDEWIAQENITVAGEGNYVFDLLLVPSFAELDAIPLDDEEIPAFTDPPARSLVPLWSLIVGVALLFAIAIFYLRNLKRFPRELDRQAEEDEFRAAVLGALRKHNGRITQKDLRREMPFSEAKVSLVLTQLEHEGLIEKIKKGRGNVIVKK